MKLKDIIPIIGYCDVVLYDAYGRLINITHSTIIENTAATYLDSTVLFIEPSVENESGVANIEIYLDVIIIDIDKEENDI